MDRFAASRLGPDSFKYGGGHCGAKIGENCTQHCYDLILVRVTLARTYSYRQAQFVRIDKQEKLKRYCHIMTYEGDGFCPFDGGLAQVGTWVSVQLSVHSCRVLPKLTDLL